MTVLKGIADIVGRLAHLLVRAPAEPTRALTEDDIRTDRYRQRHQARG